VKVMPTGWADAAVVVAAPETNTLELLDEV